MGGGGGGGVKFFLCLLVSEKGPMGEDDWGEKKG